LYFYSALPIQPIKEAVAMLYNPAPVDIKIGDEKIYRNTGESRQLVRDVSWKYGFYRPLRAKKWLIWPKNGNLEKFLFFLRFFEKNT